MSQLTKNLDRYEEVLAAKKVKKKELDELNAELDSLEKEQIEIMLAEEVGSFKHKGITYYLSTRTYARLSPNLDDREILYASLLKRGREIYHKIVGINSMSATSYYNAEYKIAESEGREDSFKIVGLEKSKEEPTLCRKA